MTPMSCSRQIRKEFVFGILIEDVVDDLHRVDDSRGQGTQHVGGLPPVDADADRAHQSFFLQLRRRTLPPVVVGPRVAPDVKLLKIDRRDADVCEALLGVLADVVRRIDVIERVLGPCRPSSILRRDLRCRVQTFSRMSRQQFAEQLLAVSIAVRPRGVEEVAAQALPPGRASRETPHPRSRSSPPFPTCRTRFPRRAIQSCRNVCSASPECY